MSKKLMFALPLLLLFCFFASFDIYAQTSDDLADDPSQSKAVESNKSPAFREVSRTPSFMSHLDPTKDVPFLDSRGEISGSTRRIVDNDTQRLVVSLASGGSFDIEPLGGVIISRDGNRVISYGDPVGRHKIKTISFRIYTAGGRPVKTLNTNIWVPYVFEVADNGDIWLAGMKGDTSGGFVIARYDADGNLLWDAPLPSEVPERLALSDDNALAALVLFNEKDNSRTVYYFDAGGNKTIEQKLLPFYFGAEFISGRQIILYSSFGWESYRIDNTPERLAIGDFTGKPLGKHPITGFPDGSLFSVVTFDSQDNDPGYRLQVVDASNGEVAAEHFVAGKPSWQPYRFSRVTAAGMVELLTDSEVIELEISR